jgi:hypothetical protein
MRKAGYLHVVHMKPRQNIKIVQKKKTKEKGSGTYVSIRFRIFS